MCKIGLDNDNDKMIIVITEEEDTYLLSVNLLIWYEGVLDTMGNKQDEVQQRLGSCFRKVYPIAIRQKKKKKKKKKKR